MTEKKTPSRIYAVTNTSSGAVGLVRATSPAQAVRHVTRTLYTAEVASQEALVTALGDGVSVVDATETAGAQAE